MKDGQNISNHENRKPYVRFSWYRDFIMNNVMPNHGTQHMHGGDKGAVKAFLNPELHVLMGEGAAEF